MPVLTYIHTYGTYNFKQFILLKTQIKDLRNKRHHHDHQEQQLNYKNTFVFLFIFIWEK